MKSFRLTREPLDENVPAGKGCVILFLTANIFIVLLLLYIKFVV